MNIAHSVMTDAVEGPGLAYWAEARKVKRNQENDVVSFEVRDGGYEGPRQSEKWVSVTERKIRKAAQEMRDGKVDCHREIQSQFVGNDWEYDSIGVDCLIQHIAFGDVIYG